MTGFGAGRLSGQFAEPQAGPFGHDGRTALDDGIAHVVAEEKAEGLGGGGEIREAVVGGDGEGGQAMDGLEPDIPFGEAGVWGGGLVGVGAERFGEENPCAWADGPEGVFEEAVRNGGDGTGAVDDGMSPAPAFDEGVAPGFEGGEVEVVRDGKGDFGSEGGEACARGFEHVGFAVETGDGFGGGSEQLGEAAGACAGFDDAQAVPVEERRNPGGKVAGMVFCGDELVVFGAMPAIDFIHVGHGQKMPAGRGKGKGEGEGQRARGAARPKMRWRMARQDAYAASRPAGPRREARRLGRTL